jgi:NDP-hexose 4-ketoreductase
VRRWVELDLAGAGEQGLRKLVEAARPEVIVNAAGCVRGLDEELERANVGLVQDLIAAVAGARGSPRVVHMGSAAGYAPTTRGVPLREDAPLRPVAAYGSTKAAADRALLEAFSTGALQGAVLRVFNPVGPGAPPTSVLGRVAAELARQGAAAQARVVVGPLGSYRDFVDVRDVADAALLAASAEPVPQAALNIARGEAVSVRHAVELLVKIARPDAVVVEQGEGSARSLEVDWQQADIRAAGRLGWMPRRTLEMAIADLWRHALSTSA